MAFISLLSLGFIVFIVLFVLVESFYMTGGDLYTAPAAPQSAVGVLEALGTFSYSGGLSYAVFEAYLSTCAADKPRFKQASLGLAVGCGFLLLLLMAVFGYGAFGSNVASDVMSSFDSSSAAVQVAQLVVVLHLCFYIPNAFVLMRLFSCELAGFKVTS